MTRINTIDAEVAGEAMRLIVGGGPSVPGSTMAEKLTWLKRHGETLRTLVMLEPRGHAGMHGALLTEPVSPQAHAGLISMNAAGFSTISGEAVIAATTIGLEHKLIAAAGEEVVFDSPAGLLRARPAFASSSQNATAGRPRIPVVSLIGVPSFVHSAGLRVEVGGRKITVDIAFGGEFYAVADSEAIGIPIEMSNATQLTRMGLDLKNAIESAGHVEHPLDSRLKGIQGTIFTGAPRVASDLRSATVLEGQVLRRSPGATGTAALLAVLDAMGLVMEEHGFTHEGVLGTTLTARVSTRQLSGEVPMIVPVIEGAASITGFHEFVS